MLPDDDPDLDLDDDRRGELARRIEDAAATLGAVRYGSRLRVGPASVVLNPDSPLVSGCLASGLDGSPAAVETALRTLPAVFGEAGLTRVVLSASPSSAPELELLAEERGYEAVEETTTMLLTRPARLAEGEPGRITQVLRDADEHRVGPLLAEAHDWSEDVGRRLQVVMGHRLDDPRHVAMAAYDHAGGGELAGLATGFLHRVGRGGQAPGAIGQLVDVAVRPRFRSRGLGRALGSAVTAALLTRGADLVWLTVDAGGRAERFCADLGFESAYDAVTYVLPVE